MSRPFSSTAIRPAQRGFSLIELSIAILIALFLLGGLMTLVMGTRKTSATQSALSDLQDNQRIAMTVITNVVQKAGYFADPVGQQLSTFPAENVAAIAMAGSQVLGGTTAPGGDTFAVRFLTPAADPNASVINCAGQSNPAPSSAPVAGVWYTNLFQVAVVNGTSWLQCQVTTNPAGTVLTVNLIPNIQSMSVLYGVAVGGGSDDYSVIQYLNAAQMSAANWLNVTVVKVTLNFLVPDYTKTGGQMTTATSSFTRVIPVMSRTGVNT
jgi:type IV pilus assembly protein PilW